MKLTVAALNASIDTATRPAATDATTDRSAPPRPNRKRRAGRLKRCHMNTTAIRRKLRSCKGCRYACSDCPYALPCVRQGRSVRPIECYLCWHNEGTTLPADCRLRRTPV
jgi:hypothetical protein